VADDAPGAPDVSAAFAIAGGTHAGREHLRLGRNNQDALAWFAAGGDAVAVVCDGCSSGAHSEVGAKLGARLVCETLRAARAAGQRPGDTGFWPGIATSVLGQLGAIARGLGGDLGRTVEDYLLFTVVGALVGPVETWIFHAGDGLVAVNGQVTALGPFPGNAPPYLAYGLLGAPAALEARVLPTAELDSLLVATDGVGELPGPLAPFWTDPRIFANRDQVRRTLALAARTGGTAVRDDTTLVVLRRRPAPDRGAGELAS